MCLYQQIQIKCKHAECSLVNKIIKSNAQIFDNQTKSKVNISSKQKIIGSQIQIPITTEKEILPSQFDLYNPEKINQQEEKPIIKLEIENEAYQQIRASIQKLKDELVEIKNNQDRSLKILKYIEVQIERHTNKEQKLMEEI